MKDCLEGCLMLSCCRSNYFDNRKDSVEEAKERLKILKGILKVPIQEDSLPDLIYLPLTFIPDLIVKTTPDIMLNTLPYRFDSEAVMLIVDVCGFTNIAESYCQKGISGVEELASILNGFMSTLAAMLISAGGDILNFAGDAFLVYWNEIGDRFERNLIVERVYSCALSLQTHESLKAKNLEDMLQVKIGIAKGKIVTWILGSPKDFLLFAIAGDVLPKVHEAVESCSAGDIIVTDEVYYCLKEAEAHSFKTVQVKKGFVKIIDCTAIENIQIVPEREEIFEKCSEEDIALAKKFLIPSVRDVRLTSELKYLSELTLVNILFVMLLDVDVKEATKLGKTCDIMLDCAAKQGGVLNKVVLFDKGCTYLIVFGLPGLKHSNDAARCLLCAKEIANKHERHNIAVSIGISTGTCFCGLVGHPQRQEYTVIGSRVNMASRLMTEYWDGIITLDAATYHLSRDELGEKSFLEIPTKILKGIELAGTIYTFKLGHRNIPGDNSERMDSVAVDKMTLRSFVVSENEDITMIKKCVKEMCNEKERVVLLEKTLLPVIMIEGLSANSMSYLMYKAIEIASEMNYKIFSCCTIPFCSKEEFLTAASLFQKIIGLRPEDDIRVKEEKLLNVLSGKCQNNLYLLNSLFHVKFSPPRMSNTIRKYRNSAILELFQVMYKQVCKKHYTMLVINEIDYMDEESFHLLHMLAETENVLIVMSMSKYFKEPSVSASLLYLKAHTHINLPAKSEKYCAPLICWFLNLIGVHKAIVLHLTEETDGDLELLNEACLSEYLSDYTVLVPYKDINEINKEKFFISDFSISATYKDDELFLLDLKPGITDLKSFKVPDTVSDAVKSTLNYLPVQDRLILKCAALMGSNFTQRLIETVITKLSSEQVVKSINNLMEKKIISSSCTHFLLIDTHSLSNEIFCYNMCFCSKADTRQIMRNYKTPTKPVGLHQCLTFRTELLRQWIKAFMTAEQCEAMHLEIARTLETSGQFCHYCKIKMSKKVQMAEKYDEMTLQPSQTSFKECVCLLLRPRLYKVISFVYCSMGIKLIGAYYLKKSAQAWNDINYPVQALYCAETAESMLPDVYAFVRESSNPEERHFDQDVVRASMKRTQAVSCLLLQNTYWAIVYAQQALEIFGMELIYFFGVFRRREFRRILKRLPLLHAEEITKIISILSQSLVSSRTYDIALKVLDLEYIALTYYPTDFLQLLTFMISSYLCRTLKNPRKQFQKLENNTLKICWNRLQNYKIFPSVKEIRAIGKAYATLIEANLVKNRLTYADAIAQEALTILDFRNDPDCSILLHSLLIDLHLFSNRSDECWKYLNMLSSLLDDDRNYDIFAQYYCGLSAAILMDNTVGNEGNLRIEKDIKKCNEFASKWNMNITQTMPKDLAFFVSAKMSVWCHKGADIFNWQETKTVFNRCYEMTFNLFKDQTENSYWSIGGSLAYLKLRLVSGGSEDIKENLNFVTEQLKIIKEEIMLHFPVYKEEYNQLLNDVKTFETVHLDSSSL